MKVQLDNTIRPYEVLQVAQVLYSHCSAHPSNKRLKEFIPEAVGLLELAAKELHKVVREPTP